MVMPMAAKIAAQTKGPCSSVSSASWKNQPPMDRGMRSPGLKEDRAGLFLEASSGTAVFLLPASTGIVIGWLADIEGAVNAEGIVFQRDVRQLPAG